MPDDLTGYEASSLTDVEAVLDGLTNATSKQVYLGTLGVDARAIASVAAARADAGGGGGGSLPDEWTVPDSGTLQIIPSSDDFTNPLNVQGFAGATQAVLLVEQDGNSLLAVNPDGSILHDDSTGETNLNVGDTTFNWGSTTLQPGGFQFAGPGFRVFLGSAQAFTVLDSSFGQVFSVADDGTVTGVFPDEWTVGANGSLEIEAPVTFTLGGGDEFLVRDDSVEGIAILSVLGTGGVTIQPPPGSTDNPLRVYNEAGQGVFEFGIDGAAGFGKPLRANDGLVIFKNAAPADGDINAQECAIWFDPTNGAAKLMIKAKQADGTVRTGQVTLT